MYIKDHVHVQDRMHTLRHRRIDKHSYSNRPVSGLASMQKTEQLLAPEFQSSLSILLKYEVL